MFERTTYGRTKTPEVAEFDGSAVTSLLHKRGGADPAASYQVD